MTAQETSRLAYDDASTPHEMYHDCQAAGLNLRLQRVAEAASQPAPSSRFEDYRAVAKPEIKVSDAAARLAAALHLHLD